jgi:hypothetical protein
MIPSGMISGALVFAMLGASTIGGVAAFGVCYGFFSGGGELLSHEVMPSSSCRIFSVISIVTPATAAFVTHSDYSDLGCTFFPPGINPIINFPHTSIRIGLLSFGLAFAVLTGNPIAGALLSPPRYKWLHPLIFAAVGVFLSS